MNTKTYTTGVQHVGVPTNDIEATIAFYEKLGFEKLGIRKRYYSHPTEDALIYRKVIR